MADVVGQVPGQLPTFTSGHNPQAGVPGGGTVTAVSATAPLAATPDPIVGAGSVGFPSWPADLAGELHNDGAGVLSWITDVGSFVRLLADPTIDQDVGGFHVTLSGLSDTAFLVNTLTNPSAAKFRALGTTSSILELEYTTVAANMFAGLSLLAPTGAALVINLFGSGTSGAAVGWDGGDYNLPSGAVLYGGITESHWFKLSGSTDHCGTFQLYDNGLNFFPALSLVSIDGGAAVGAVTVGANPRINAIPPDFSVFHGATTATGLGTERVRITNDDSEGPGTAKLVFGNLPAFATMSGNTSRDFQFVGNVANTNLLLNSNGPGTSQFSLYSLDGSGNGDGIHLICYAQDGVEPSEYAAFNVGAFERWQIPYTGTAILSDNTEFILEANYAGGLDGQLCLYSARVGNTATTDTRVTFGAESQTGADADFVLYTGGTESLRISGATKKVTMPGVLDPPEIDVINKVPGDTAVAPIFFAATDSGANTSNVSLGIELPNSVGVPGDLVVRTEGAGAAAPGTEVVRVTGADQSIKLTTPAVPSSSRAPVLFVGDATNGVNGAISGNPDDIYVSDSGTALNVFGIKNDQDVIGSTDFTIQTFGSLGSEGAPIILSAGSSGPHAVIINLNTEFGGNNPVGVVLTANVDPTPAGSASWVAAATGEFRPAFSDGVQDLGGASNRVRDGYFSGNVDAATFSSAGGDPFVLPAADLGGGGALVTDGSGNVSVATLAVIGTAVSLQVGTPGTPDTGNFNIGVGTGIAQTFLGTTFSANPENAIEATLQDASGICKIVVGGDGSSDTDVYFGDHVVRFHDYGDTTGYVAPLTDNKIDLGSFGGYFHDAFFGGTVDAVAYKVGGTAGLVTFSGAVTNITVVNGIVTAAS